MKQLSLTILSLFILNLSSFAQEVLNEYSWDNAATIAELTEEEQEESYVYLEYHNGVEMYYADAGYPLSVSMFHRKVHLNDDEAVDRFNKIFTPSSKSVEFIEKQARVIKKDGEVIYLDEDDILSETSEEGYSYEYFAMEGIEVGDEVEWMYTYHAFPRFSRRLTFQESGLIRNMSFVFICPENLEMAFKSYNGLPEVLLDSNYENDELNYYKLADNNIPKMSDEKYAANDANEYYLVYRLDKNTGNGFEADPYPSFSKNMGETLGSIIPKKIKIKKLIKKAEIEDTDSEEKKIRKAEEYIKQNYTNIGFDLAQYSDPKAIIKSEIGGPRGLIKVYSALFQYYDIKYELVYTTDRMEYKFDPDFDCNVFLEEALFYFPELDMYMSPSNIISRLGLTPMTNAANHGLFIKVISLNGAFSGFGKVKMIEPLDADKTVDEFVVEASFENLPNTDVVFHRELSGYAGSQYQVIYDYGDDEAKQEITEGFVNYIDEDMEIKEVTAENLSPEDITKNPIVIDAEFSTENFVSKAGNNYLINVGKMIGPQAEMYNEGERKNPVELYYNHIYTRKIVINIPDGYEIANPEEVEFNIAYAPEGSDEQDMGFVSTWKIENGKLVIEISEFYKSIYYTMDRYDDFQKVVNAAADFNKVNLLLKKK